MFETFTRSRREAIIQREAAAWIARLHSAQCTEEDRARFHKWQASSKLHGKMFRDAEAAWDELRYVPITARPAVGSVGQRDQPDRADIEGAGGFWDRRRFIAACSSAAAVAVGGGGFVAWNAAATTTTYETKHGESRHIDLGKGLSFELDVLSRVKVRNDGRQIEVENGRVRIAIKDRSTVIRFGGHDMETSGAQVDVQCTDGELTQMLMVSGTGMLVQNAGSQIALKAPCLVDGAETKITTPDDQSVMRLTAWTSGRVIFQNDRLSDAIALMNRYDNVPIRVRDSDLARLEISGMFRLGDNRRFADTVRELLPIAVADRGSELVLEPAPGM